MRHLTILTTRFFLAAIVLFVVGAYDKLAGMFLAGVILSAPSWKRIPGRLATGAQEDDKYKKDLLDALKLSLKNELETRATKEDVTRLLAEGIRPFEGMDLEGLRSMLKPDTGVMAILAKQGMELKKLGQTPGAGEDLSIRGHVSKWAEGNQAALKGIKDSGRKQELEPLQFRAAASPMTPANSLTTAGGSIYLPQPQFQPGIYNLRRVKPTLWDYIQKGRSSSAAYVWVNKKNPQGAAAFIGVGIAKPPVSFELQTEISNAKKVAVSSKVAMELLYDIDGMASFIQDEMVYQLRKAINLALQSGTLSSTSIGGIQGISQVYTLGGSALKATTPNNLDVLFAAAAQISYNFVDAPLFAFLNPLDFAQIKLTKDTTGQYVFPPQNQAGIIEVNGITIVEDYNVAVGSFGLYALDLYKVLIYQDLMIAQGWENDDFTKNLVTFIAEMRMHVFFSDNDKQGFIYDTFAHVKATLLAS